MNYHYLSVAKEEGLSNNLKKVSAAKAQADKDSELDLDKEEVDESLINETDFEELEDY